MGCRGPNHGLLGHRCAAAAKARGVVIGGMRDKSLELQAEARERAEALREVFAELAGRIGPWPRHLTSAASRPRPAKAGPRCR
jgi:hypothetical protein